MEEASLDSSTQILRERKYPRSYAQQLLDEVEDTSGEVLSLSGLGAEKVSSRLFDLITLTSLNLSYNKLSGELPADIQFLPKLLELDISHNRIESIPVEIEELRQLQVFRAAGNCLSTLPGNFFKLRELVELDLSWNRFAAMPVETGSLELLKELREWEVSVGMLTKLSRLLMAHCALAEWPKQLERLGWLYELDLSFNQIPVIAPLIGQCASLAHLNVSNNQLYHFPVEIYSLKLESLDLSCNRIAHLAPFKEKESYAIRKHLYTLQLSHNELTELGAQMGLFYRVTYLDASHNLIASIHESISSLLYLETLCLSHNMLAKLPTALRTCTALVYVDLSANRLEELPPVLFSLLSLLTLILAHNKISSIPEDALQKFGKLEWLDLSFNLIAAFPRCSGSSLRSLRYLDLSGNRLAHMDCGIGHLSTLEQLNLNSNLLARLSPDVSALTRLVSLELEANLLVALPEDLAACKNMRHIALARNQFITYPTDILSRLPLLQHWNMSFNPINTKKMAPDTSEAELPEPDSQVLLQNKLSAFRAQITGLSERLADESRSPSVSGKIREERLPVFLNRVDEKAYLARRASEKQALRDILEGVNDYHASLSRHVDDLVFSPFKGWLESAHPSGELLTRVELDAPWYQVEGVDVSPSLHAIALDCERVAAEISSSVTGRSIQSNGCPVILHSSDFSALSDPFLCLAAECYMVLGSALMQRVERLNGSVRALERLGGKASLLDVSQRRTEDCLDLVGDLLAVLAEEGDKKAKPSIVASRSRQQESTTNQAIGAFDFLIEAVRDKPAVELLAQDIFCGVSVLMAVRRTLLHWAYFVIDAADELLRSLGWDPKSPSFHREGGTVFDFAKDQKSHFANVSFTKAKVCQALGLHHEAVGIYRRVSVLFPMWISSFVEVTKSLVCEGKYGEAQGCVFDIAYKEYSGRVSDPPTVLQLMEVNRELGLLLLLIQAGLGETAKVQGRGKTVLPAYRGVSRIKTTLPNDTAAGRPADHDCRVARTKEEAAVAEERESRTSQRENLMRRCNLIRGKAMSLSEQVKSLQ